MDRALIIRKPHIDKILSGEKIWEMRSRPTKITGRIGLIEAGSGLIVGEANLVRTGIPIDNYLIAEQTKSWHCVDDLSKLKKWRYPWVIEKAKRYEKPIPYDHPKGAVIWVNVELPDLGEPK